MIPATAEVAFRRLLRIRREENSMVENSNSPHSTLVTSNDLSAHRSLWDKGQHPFMRWDSDERQRFIFQLREIAKVERATIDADPSVISKTLPINMLARYYKTPAEQLLAKVELEDNELQLLEKHPEETQIRRGIERLSKADPDKVQEVVAAQLDLMQGYYQEVLNQSQRSFRSALIAAAVGLIFFLAAITFALFQQPTNLTAVIITAIGGTLAEFIAALNFRLYGDASKQLAEFQSRLDKTQGYLLANSISSGLNEENRQAALQELVRTISGQEKLESNPAKADFPNRATI